MSNNDDNEDDNNDDDDNNNLMYLRSVFISRNIIYKLVGE